MSKFYIARGSDETDWRDFKVVLVRAFENNDYHTKLFPDDKTRSKLVGDKMQHRYDTGIKGERGSFAVIRMKTTNKKEKSGENCVKVLLIISK